VGNAYRRHPTASISSQRWLGANRKATPRQRHVVDRTGLVGHFDIDLHWLPDNLPPRPQSDTAVRDPGALSVFTAVQEQLGLKFEPAKGPVDVIIIDSVERLSED
jgi:uncharacterized protein (TIGR03435 family)